MSEQRTPVVIVVDDDEAKRYSVARLLTSAGYRVTEAGTGAEALRLAQTVPDLIVLDVNLPDLNGMDVCRQIKAQAETASIPILHLSATSIRTGDRVQGLNSGADGYLAEPVESRELLATVNSLLRVRQAEETVRRLLLQEQAARAEALRHAEELQRANEQLQVANEELAVINEELHAQQEQLRHLNDEIETAQRRAEFLAEAGNILLASLERPETLRRVARLAVPYLADWCGIDLLAEAAAPSPVGPEAFRCVALEGMDPAREVELREALRRSGAPVHESFGAGEAVRAGEVFSWPDPGAPSAGGAPAPVLGGLAVTSLLCIPLTTRGRTFGAITLMAGESGRRFTAADRALAAELARRVTVAVENAALYRDVQQADRRKDEFIAMLGHELRNPLGVLNNALHLLSHARALDEAGARYHAVAARQTQQLTRLVEDLLDVSRISRGKIELRREPLDLAALVQQAVQNCRGLIEERRQELSVSVPSTPVPVDADPDRVAQVLTNLVNNAAKFTGPGGRIQVSLETGEEPGQWAVENPEPGVSAQGVVGRREPGTGNTERGTRNTERGTPPTHAVLRVRDTGVGIAPEMLPRIFDLFTQAESTVDQSRGGLGIGLTLVRSLVEQHGGTIRAHSEGLGKGAEFEVRLPLAGDRPRGAQHATPHPHTHTPTHPHTHTALRVLVVDDNADGVETLAEIVTAWGHAAEIARDGNAAVGIARSFRPDVVLCDIGLPGMDGYQVAAALRAAPETAGVLLIAVSGYGQERDVSRAREAGFDAHVAKPVDPEQIRKLMAPGGASRPER